MRVRGNCWELKCQAEDCDTLDGTLPHSLGPPSHFSMLKFEVACGGKWGRSIIQF